MDRLSEATQLIMSVLMFIGASPSSAAGIRTTTFAILILFLIAFREDASILISFKATCQKDIERAFAVFTLAVGLVFSGVLIVLIADGHQFTDANYI